MLVLIVIPIYKYNKMLMPVYENLSKSQVHVSVGLIRLAKYYWVFTATILSHYPI